MTTRGQRQHGRPEEPARRAGDERLAFQMDELPERLPTAMVRPVKRPPVVLQVVSYASTEPPPTTSPTSRSSVSRSVARPRSTRRGMFAILTTRSISLDRRHHCHRRRRHAEIAARGTPRMALVLRSDGDQLGEKEEKGKIEEGEPRRQPRRDTELLSVAHRD